MFECHPKFYKTFKTLARDDRSVNTHKANLKLFCQFPCETWIFTFHMQVTQLYLIIMLLLSFMKNWLIEKN